MTDQETREVPGVGQVTVTTDQQGQIETARVTEGPLEGSYWYAHRPGVTQEDKP